VNIEEMEAKQVELVVQRAQHKDAVEGIEMQLKAVAFAISNAKGEAAKEAKEGEDGDS